MFQKYIVPASGALTLTVALFLGMYFLIAPDTREKPETGKVIKVEIGAVADLTEPRPKVRKPEPPDDTAPPPEAPELMTHEPDVARIGTGIPPQRAPLEPITANVIGFAEGDIQAMTKFAPAYPRNMLMREIEGYAIVQFTVNRAGAVENAVVIETSHPGFSKPSLEAVKRFKYKPRVIDGAAVAVHNVLERVSFKIDN